jgi:probable rRNA maturation factor
VVVFQTRVSGLTKAALTGFVRRARRAAGLHGRLSLLITGDREMRRLNRRFRGKDRPTDVLSFPAAPAHGGDFAGDVAVSADIAARSAKRMRHSTAKEIKILTLHGILHLAGYDHERDRGQMARKEGQLRRLLKLPVGLIGRSKEDAMAGSKKKNRSVSRRRNQPHLSAAGEASRGQRKR